MTSDPKGLHGRQGGISSCYQPSLRVAGLEGTKLEFVCIETSEQFRMQLFAKCGATAMNEGSVSLVLGVIVPH